MQLTKRRLTDLWVTGRELILDDGDGDPLVVWLQKVNPGEATDTQRRCDAARARVLSVRSQPDAYEYQALQGSVVAYSDDPAELVKFLLGEDRVKAQRSQEAQLANEEEWSKDNYLQGLRDAWDDDLQRRWLEDNADVEGARVHDELERFTDEVKARVDDDMEALTTTMLATTTFSDLQDRMVGRLLEIDGTQAWLNELYRCQLYYGVREPDDHKKLYFVDRDEVDQLSTATFGRLRTAYDNLEVDVAEGKGSRPDQASSPSSEPPNEVPAETSSGLVAVGA
jgi:hypothetical protein